METIFKIWWLRSANSWAIFDFIANSIAGMFRRKALQTFWSFLKTSRFPVLPFGGLYEARHKSYCDFQQTGCQRNVISVIEWKLHTNCPKVNAIGWAQIQCPSRQNSQFSVSFHRQLHQVQLPNSWRMHKSVGNAESANAPSTWCNQSRREASRSVRCGWKSPSRLLKIFFSAINRDSFVS